MGAHRNASSLKPFVWGAIVFHVFLAFHNYCGVDGTDWFSHYSKFAFGSPGARYFYYSASFGAYAIPHLLSCSLHIPLTVCAKIIQALCWIACSYLVVKVFADRTMGSPRFWFICLALNPVAIFNLHYHVQSDAMVFLLMLGGLALYLQNSRWTIVVAGLCWAVAISAKVYPALLAPFFIFDRTTTVRKKTLFYGCLMLFFILSELPWIFKIGWLQTLITPLRYQSFSRFGLSRIVEAVGGGGWHGLFMTWVFTVAGSYSMITTIILVIALGSLIFLRRLSLYQAMGFYFALLLLFSTKNAPQYLIFVIPFLPLMRSKAALIFANAAYALILAFFYLLDIEMSGSYCLLRGLGFLSISQHSLACWEGYKPLISLYLWGYLYLLATLVFALAYRSRGSETPDGMASTAALGSGVRSLLCGIALALWCIAFFSVRFTGNPFSYPDNGLPEGVNCNTVLEPPSTLDWYGSKGEYELKFSGLKPGDAVRVSGDSYFSVRLADRVLGPYRGDGNKLYSFWWGISYPLTYDVLRDSGFKATVINHLCSIRGINAITARLIGRGRDWDPYGHELEGKIEVERCRVDGVDYGVQFGERRGWLDSIWLTISPKNYRFKGNSYVNIFTINLLYIVVFFVVMARRLKMGEM